MGITERREREKQEVRQRILDAARELFVKDGYEAVTMRKVADAIEYSPTALYLHFKDKEALIRELCHEDFLSLARAFQRIAREPDPLERLRKIGHAYVDFGLTHPNHYRLMFMTERGVQTTDEEQKEMGKGNPTQDAYAFLRATVVEALLKEKLRPEFTDPDLISQALWAGVHGVVSLHVAMRHDSWMDWKPVRKVAALVTDTMVDGLARKKDR